MRRAAVTRTGTAAPGAAAAGIRLFLLSPNRTDADVLFLAGNYKNDFILYL